MVPAALSSAERSRRRRAKLRVDPKLYDEYKTEQSKKKKEYRHKTAELLTEAQKFNIREQNRKAQKNRRAKKKVEKRLAYVLVGFLIPKPWAKLSKRHHHPYL